MATKDVHSSRAPEPVGPYPHAKRVGNLIFFSGVGPRTRRVSAGAHSVWGEIPGVTFAPDGSVASVDIELQCRSCFDNLRMICEEANVAWTALVDVTVYLTDMARDFKTYNRVYAEYFAGPGNPNPTRTTLGITALPTPIAVEIKAMAVVG